MCRHAGRENVCVSSGYPDKICTKLDMHFLLYLKLVKFLMVAGPSYAQN